MRPYVTFIIPVRHQSNSKDWSSLKVNLAQTITSISAQTNKNWHAVIVANQGADLPDLPPNFEILRVDFPPNEFHEQQGIDKEKFYDAIRLDKGQRVLKGMLHFRETEYYMIVDDDDFVSNRIVEFVSKNLNENGWKINQGYIWGHGGKLLIQHNDFASFCGTSLIIRSDLYALPDEFNLASSDYIKVMLGSHIKIGKVLENQGNALNNLPFRGAIYRIGHAGSHSKSPTILNKYFLQKELIFNPRELARNLLKLRFVSTPFKKEFFGDLTS